MERVYKEGVGRWQWPCAEAVCVLDRLYARAYTDADPSFMVGETASVVDNNLSDQAEWLARSNRL